MKGNRTPLHRGSLLRRFWTVLSLVLSTSALAAQVLPPLPADLNTTNKLPTAAGLFVREFQFESNTVFTSPDSTLATLLSAIESLDWSARHAWSSCTKREFNVGYEGGDEPLSVSDDIAPKTLARVVAVGGSLRITVYAPKK